MGVTSETSEISDGYLVCPEAPCTRDGIPCNVKIDFKDVVELIKAGFIILIVPPDYIDFCVIGPIKGEYEDYCCVLRRHDLIQGIKAGVYVVGVYEDKLSLLESLIKNGIITSKVEISSVINFIKEIDIGTMVRIMLRSAHYKIMRVD